MSLTSLRFVSVIALSIGVQLVACAKSDPGVVMVAGGSSDEDEGEDDAGESSGQCEAGEERCECRSGDRCDEGLECRSDICVEAESDEDDDAEEDDDAPADDDGDDEPVPSDDDGAEPEPAAEPEPGAEPEPSAMDDVEPSVEPEPVAAGGAGSEPEPSVPVGMGGVGSEPEPVSGGTGGTPAQGGSGPGPVGGSPGTGGQPSGTEGNLLLNGDFADAGTYWKVDDGVAAVSYATTSGALCVTLDSYQNFVAVGWPLDSTMALTLDPGTTYEFSFDARATDTSYLLFDAKVGEAVTPFYEHFLTSIDASSTTTRYAFTFTPTSSSPSGVVFLLTWYYAIYGYSSQVCVDNVVLRAL